MGTSQTSTTQKQPNMNYEGLRLQNVELSNIAEYKDNTQHWATNVLRQLASEVIDLAKGEVEDDIYSVNGGSFPTIPVKDILSCVQYFVINYRSPLNSGKRFTLTCADYDSVTLAHKNATVRPDTRPPMSQNHQLCMFRPQEDCDTNLKFISENSLSGCSELDSITKWWNQKWQSYFSNGGFPTLNQLFLNYSPRMVPIKIHWQETDDEFQAFTTEGYHLPLTINLSKQSAEYITTDANELSATSHNAIKGSADRFWDICVSESGFLDSCAANGLTPPSPTELLQAILKQLTIHFKIQDTKIFVSIPTSWQDSVLTDQEILSVGESSRENRAEHGFKTVVSYALNRNATPRIQAAAFRLFSDVGLALGKIVAEEKRFVREENVRERRLAQIDAHAHTTKNLINIQGDSSERVYDHLVSIKELASDLSQEYGPSSKFADLNSLILNCMTTAVEQRKALRLSERSAEAMQIRGELANLRIDERRQLQKASARNFGSLEFNNIHSLHSLVREALELAESDKRHSSRTIAQGLEKLENTFLGKIFNSKKLHKFRDIEQHLLTTHIYELLSNCIKHGVTLSDGYGPHKEIQFDTSEFNNRLSLFIRNRTRDKKVLGVCERDRKNALGECRCEIDLREISTTSSGFFALHSFFENLNIADIFSFVEKQGAQLDEAECLLTVEIRFKPNVAGLLSEKPAPTQNLARG